MRARPKPGPWIGLALLGLMVVAPAVGAALAGPSASPSPDDTTVTFRMPADVAYPHIGMADSAVVFRHDTHLPLLGHDCTGCHPRPFPMLSRGPVPSHRAMAMGGSCGACHNGRQAFGIRDRAACGSCHSGTKPTRMAAGAITAASPGPPPHPYTRGPESPGLVTFRHATHLEKRTCAACHPRPFSMSPPAPRPGGGAMHAAAACGACHDGRKAFGCGDMETCRRCHAGAGS
jgi:c(7)-type cytochrome triheme protein